MRLHHYAPAVSHSYCVGVHNGHGFGSLFARLFSKVAAKTAAKTAARAALRVAKSAGKKALKEVTKQGTKVVKELGKTALEEGSKAAGEFLTQKITQVKEKALNSGIPKSLVHSTANAATGGVQKLQKKVVPKLHSAFDTNIDKAREKLETAAGLDRKKKARKRENTVRSKNSRFRKVNKLRGPDLNSILWGKDE